MPKKKRWEIIRDEMERIEEDGQRPITIEILYNQILHFSFLNAVKLVNYAAELKSTDLVQDYQDAFLPYYIAKWELRELEKAGAQIMPKTNWLDGQWYTKEQRDFFSALDPSTREELIKQGIKYE
jgi:hypothetical protein